MFCIHCRVKKIPPKSSLRKLLEQHFYRLDSSQQCQSSDSRFAKVAIFCAVQFKKPVTYQTASVLVPGLPVTDAATVYSLHATENSRKKIHHSDEIRLT